MNDLTFLSLPGLTPGDAAALDAEAKLKRAQSDTEADPLRAAKLQGEADGLEALATRLRAPPAPGLPELRLGRGGEISPLPDRKMSVPTREIADTVQSPPDMLGAQATMDRLILARDAGVLTEAVEAAESVGAEGAVEQMLVHGITAAHGLFMRLIAAGNTALRTHEHDARRNATSAARLMDSVTRAASALDRMRNGGHQHVTVERLMVADGGQALVAGKVEAGGGAALMGRRYKGGRGPK
jgi:hypothetical protein